ncbi:hypothetical protein N7508_000418 [Penicillium antarcticum]|uniref:uncharacterized protein n=1 Tax=Penicillium antarcticum TaxID=416450 RepID=UPI002397D807|nr:uncharacterized protein N7508_000418 [Penicillium antarcticum]KAJ5320135.1 hypothetical protein N7508_000418 [Penicillium antarcticum]
MMNRFRKNKKVKNTLGDLEGESPAFILKGSKKRDVQQPKPEPDFDLSAALPSTDDFRTSLLMPKLSARFSMLKEQDDPLSLLGKASDDSVLFPKRASRLNLFGHNPNMLADIDECSSNDGSRPSMALGRTDSFASGGDGYGTDDDRSQAGSMMSRGRRAEGNNLFGGRQKVYKIPVRGPGGPNGAPESASRGMGKPVYEHDMNLSAFQRLRLKEKEEKAVEEAREAAARESEYAPSTVSSNDRTTYSSIASGPLSNVQSLTPATSVDESPLSASSLPPAGGYPFPETVAEPNRSNSAMSNPKTGSIRTRRLYGQGLTQAAQSQQTSTLHRLESLSRQRAGTPDLPSLNRNYSRSATNLRDRLQKLAINEPASASPTSPPSSATSPKPRISGESALKERISPIAATFGAAPLSPPSSEAEDVAALLAASIHPEDHGKATAMGLFNRPATGFDEQAFSRRQLQMHQGRDTPPPRRSSPPRRPPPAEPASQRPRGLSKSSYRSRAESASSHYSSEAHRGVDHSRASSIEASPYRGGGKTFYANSTASESGDEGDDRRSHDLSSATSLATEYGQSIQRSSVVSNAPSTQTKDHLETLPEVRYSDLGDLKPIEENDSFDAASSHECVPPRPDSPTIQADPGLGGMGGMVRSHLRQQSDRSSIFPPPSPRLPEHEPEEPVTKDTIPMVEQSREYARPSSATRPSTSSSHAPSAHSAEGIGSRNSEDSSAPGVGGAKTPSWKEEMASFSHRRDGSTETQKEREEFAIELAERRRKVQEKLRSVAESESRSSSPTPGRSTPDFTRTGNAFAMLKQKASKQAMPKPDQKKLFGYNNSSSPALASDDSWREERPPFSFGQHSNSSSPQIGERSFRSRMPTLSRNNSHEESRESSRSRGPSPHGAFRSQRDRSGSDASGRSKSRTRYRERDDLQTVEEGSVIAHDNFVVPEGFEPPMPISLPPSNRPSVEMAESPNVDRAPSAASGRLRSTSRSGTPSFQYERPFQFPNSNTSSIIGASPRPSPAAPPYSANATPPLNEVPANTSSTSLASAANSAHTIPQRAPGHGFLLKRPVNKKQISEPTFVSSTSNVPLVGLQSQSGSAPPLPPMNPRRRRGTATQTILGAFKSDKHDSSRVASPAPSTMEEQSVFPDDELRPRSRNRLRKTSSESGNLNARARQESRSGSPPAVPQYPPPAVPVDGGMF